jgi:hypothetical protein
MPIRRIAGTDTEYYLIVFDEQGKERREPDGTLMSERVRQQVAAVPVTDVFFTSHGWKGDVPAAIEQYDAWIRAMLNLAADRTMAAQRRPGFRSLIVGLHWPSQPWGDETIPKGARGRLLSSSDELTAPIESQVDAYASRIADSAAAREALRTIFEAARTDNTGELSPAVRRAYDTLFAESGLATGDPSGRPGADQDGFDPAAIVADARAAGALAGTPAAVPGVLGAGEDLREALLMPLRQLSFWKMKDRARHFGETGGHDLLCQLQEAAPTAHFHLMGHSFGCIVVSATVAGGPRSRPLPRPVDSLFLVQGALSIWAYAADVPYAPGTAGYFHTIVRKRLVRGPIVTTRSSKDTAVGRFYPLGAKLRKQVLLGDTEYPKYGGIGAFGIQGIDVVQELLMQPPQHVYGFRSGGIYNLEASRVIRNGSGASGAHSDIAHPEVAHAFWEAVLTEPTTGARHDRPTAVPSAPSLAPPPAPGGPALPHPASPEARPAPAADGAPSPRRPKVLSRASRPSTFGGSDKKSRSGGASPPKFEESLSFGVRPGEPRNADAPRWFNVELEDQAPDAPLASGQWYTLAFDVDVVQRDTAIATAGVDDRALFPDDTDEVQLTVQLDSADFEIAERTRPLRLPRVGRSRGKARFDISPRHDGPSTMRATIHKDGNFIQQIDLTFVVGAARPTAVDVTRKGRPPSAAAVVNPRDVGLSVQPAPGGGYDCIVWGAVASRARLPVQQPHLASAIEAARRELMKVVMYQDDAGEYVFQESIDIPDAAREFALTTLARAGARLFQQLFFGPAAGADSKAVGEYLRNVAGNPATRLKLQIIAESVPVPWGVLYLGDASAGAPLDWNRFLGMRHVLECIPLQNTATPPDCDIPSEPQLAVSVNVNSTIDVQMGATFVAQQHAFWAQAAKQRPRIRVTPRTTRAQVVQALASGDDADQIVYFYCHAESAGLGDPGGPDTSSLVLTDDSITLGDLSLDAPASTPLRGSPLVFINACESADLSPLFYDGFVPYFMAKGARGVVGTECQTPALFAADWAQRFFNRFLDGEPVGEVFLALRRELLEQHGNPLGLLYAVHCDGDIRIEPALKASAAPV